MIIRSGTVFIFDKTATKEESELLKSCGFRYNAPVKNRWCATDPSSITRSLSTIGMCEPSLAQDMRKLREKMVSMLELSSSSDGEAPVELPEGLELMPFQKSGIAYMLAAERCLNADDMGLGKTVQGACCIKALFDSGKAKTALVVCPSSLKINWQREIKTWVGMDAEVVSSKWIPKRCRLAIINYDILLKMSAWIDSMQWDILIADESHYIKGTKAIRTRELMKIRSKYFFALSGTPMPNNPSELFTVLNKMRPDMFPDKWRFWGEYCYITKEFGHMKILGGKNLEKLKNKLRANCMVRRKKEDVLKDLPPKRRQIIEIENTIEKLTSNELTAYESVARLKAELKNAKRKCDETHDVESHRSALETVAAKTDEYQCAYGKLSTARKELAVGKVPMCVGHILTVLDSVDKLVVFGYHKEAIAGIIEALVKHDIETVCIVGDTPMKERQDAVDRFQKGTARVIVGSLGAMGVGLTLTSSSTVIMTELDWTPSTLAQCEDRCARIGQKSSVLIQYLVLQESLDGKMIRKLVVKGRLIEQVME